MKGASEKPEGLRERKRRETSERIIKKGLKLFVKNGYEATTLDAIAEAAQHLAPDLLLLFQVQGGYSAGRAR